MADETTIIEAPKVEPASEPEPENELKKDNESEKGKGKEKPKLKDLSPKELLKVIESLAPAQLKAVGEAAIAAGLAPPPSTADNQGIVLPDGRVQVLVTFDPDLGAQLKLWAEAQGNPLAAFIVDALTSYVQMDWQAMQAV